MYDLFQINGKGNRNIISILFIYLYISRVSRYHVIVFIKALAAEYPKKRPLNCNTKLLFTYIGRRWVAHTDGDSSNSLEDEMLLLCV